MTSADFDMQEVLRVKYLLALPPSGGSEAVVEEDVVPEEIKEEELDVSI